MHKRPALSACPAGEVAGVTARGRLAQRAGPVPPPTAGFTLVEVLVATVILAIGLLGALTAFSTASRVTGRSAQDTAVTLLAQEKLADVMIDLQAGELASGVTSGDFGHDRPGYRWRLVVTPPDEYRVSRVRLTIYARGAGRRHETVFETAVFPSGTE